MNRMQTGIATLALATLAGTASAGSGFGDIIFTDQFTDTIYRVESSAGATPTALLDLSGLGPQTRLADIIRGPSGEYYVADAGWEPPSSVNPFPNPSNSNLVRVNDLLGTPTTQIVTNSNPLQNPIGLVYDNGLNRVVAINNPSLTDTNPDSQHGLVGVDITGPYPNPGIVMYREPNNSEPRPRFDEGSYIINDPTGVGDYIAVSVNGGDFRGGAATSDRASQIYRFNVNDPGANGTTDELLVDFSDSFTNFGFNMNNVRGLTNIGTTLYFTALDRKEIWSAELLPDGTLPLGSFQVIADDLAFPEAIEYNPFTGKLVFAELNQGNGFISQINPDGTGYEVIATGVHARGFEFIPAPASVALLGLGGLVAARRRRA